MGSVILVGIYIGKRAMAVLTTAGENNVVSHGGGTKINIVNTDSTSCQLVAVRGGGFFSCGINVQVFEGGVNVATEVT